jgi:fibronectin type 3 domain-containing protein
MHRRRIVGTCGTIAAAALLAGGGAVAATSPPAAPSSLSAKPGNAASSLTWSPVTGATSYKVYRQSSNGSWGSALATVNAPITGYTNTGLSNGTSYTYRVTAVSSGGEGAPSPTATATPSSTLPVTPSGLKATNGPASVKLAWNANKTVPASYRVYRENQDGTWPSTATATVEGTITSFTDQYLTPGTTYVYRVSAIDSSGHESALSSGVTGVPTKPSAPTTPSLTATAGPAQVVLAWTASISQGVLNGYYIYRMNSNGTWPSGPTATVSPSTLSYTDGGLTPGTKYTYKVQSFDAYGQVSAFSSTASATPTLPPPPAPPATLTANAGNASVALAWSSVTGAASYRVYRQNADGTWPTTALATVSSTAASYTDTTVTNGTKYTYRVTAVDTYGQQSLASPTASATPLAAPGAPTGLTATPGNTTVSLSWNAVNTSATYRVYRQSPDGTWPTTPLATVSSPITSYTDGGLTNGKNYTYRVTAVNSGGESPPSSTASATPVPPPPAPPLGLAATAGNAQVSLTWQAVPGVAGYDLYRQNSDGSWPTAPLATVNAPTTSYTDATTANGSTYTYRVTSVDAYNQQSAPSLTASANPEVCAPAYSYGKSIMSTAGLVGYWPLNDSSLTTACDATGSSPGSYLGGVALGGAGPIAGDPDTSASFDGSTGYMQAQHTSAMDVGDTFTVEAWVKRAAVGTQNNQVIASQQNLSWVLEFNSSDQLVLRQSTIADVAASTDSLTDTGGWHFVAATKNGSSVHLYIDGQDVTGSVANLVMNNNNQPLSIGQSTGGAYFAGSIAQVAVFNTVLAASQISSSYQAAGIPKPAPPSAPASLQAASGNGSIKLSWSAVAGAGNYRIYRQNSDSSWPSSPIATVLGSATTYSDQLPYGTVAAYRVTAVDNFGQESSPSNTASSQSLPPPPAAPGGLSVVAGNASVRLTWNSVSASDTYRVYRQNADGSWPATPLANVGTSTGYIDTSVTNNTRYTYRVTSVDSYNQESAPSSSSSAAPGPCAPGYAYGQSIASTQGLVGYWPLNDSSLASACDVTYSSPGAYQGTVTLGNPGPIAGDPDTSASFDGSTGYMSAPHTSALDVGDTFTIEAWVKRGAVGTQSNQVIASQQNLAWVLELNSSDQLVLRQSTVADLAASTSTLTDTGGWHFVAATKNGPSVHLYIDGQDVTGPVANQTMQSNAQPLAIGESANSAYFSGAIAQVALFNTALTASQISSEYQLGGSPSSTPQPPTGLSAAATSGRVELSWTAPSGGAASYRIYRQSADGSWPQFPVATVAGSGTTYVDTGLNNGTAYTYRVTTVNSTGAESSPSSTATATPQVCGAGSAFSAAVAGTSGLVGYWRLGDSGATACDVTGHSTGSYQGDATVGLPSPFVGDPSTGAALDGTTGSVSIVHTPFLDVGDKFTIQAWVRRAMTGTAGYQTIASQQSGSWALQFNASDQLVLSGASGGVVASSTGALTDTNGWHFVAATKNGSGVHLFIDGQDITGPVSSLAMQNNTQPLVIGQNAGGSYFSGAIAEVALFNTALSAGQIASEYSAASVQSPATSDPVVAAAGDIACSAADPNYNNGSGTGSNCMQQLTANLVSGTVPAAVLPLGDTQYYSGTLQEYLGAYDLTWGAFKNITRPTPGNHEYVTTGAQGYFDYFDGSGNQTGSAGDRSRGYYSFNLGNWHLIAINANCSEIGGCGTGSPQESWLSADLASDSSPCTLAYWHQPRYSSGPNGSDPDLSQIWQDLYSYHADIVLSGHDHDYERFGPQDNASNLDPQNGVREFVTGTGGDDLFTFSGILPNSEVRQNTNFGILRLTLHATSYDWRYLVAGTPTIQDAGMAACHHR